MIPDFIDGVNLVPGGHRCTIEEIEVRFGVGPQRVHLCDKLKRLLSCAKRCGFLHLLIGGSFATSNEAPKDLDLTWFVPATMTPNNVRKECADLMDSANSRERFGCDMMFIPLSDPKQVDEWAFNFGFDAKAKKDRGTLVLEQL